MRFAAIASNGSGTCWTAEVESCAMDHEARIRAHFAASAELKLAAGEALAPALARAAEAMTACLFADGRILACGNGGSAGDAQHFAAEMVGRFERERPELPAISLSTDTSILTAIANDYAFDAGVRQAGAGARPQGRRAARDLDVRQLGQRDRRHRGRARARDARGRAHRQGRGPHRRDARPRATSTSASRTIAPRASRKCTSPPSMACATPSTARCSATTDTPGAPRPPFETAASRASRP